MSRYFLVFLSFFDFVTSLTHITMLYYNICRFSNKGEQSMKINAYAKINLTLNVVEKRSDGYHNVDMLMQSVSLCDIIDIEKIFSGIELSGTGSLTYDKTNLAYKAAKLFFDVSGVRGGVRIHINKNIPMCAGMAGGSADAAAVLKGLNTLYGNPIFKSVLLKIASRLGADVPFCILEKTARATGIGDKLTVVAPMPRKCVLVVKPPVSVSTPEAYGSLDFENMAHPDTEKAVDAIAKSDMKLLYSLMANSFEYSIFKKYPKIASIKAKLADLGADASLMSGSGSAVFGIFEDEAKAKEAYEIFKKEYSEVFICHTV